MASAVAQCALGEHGTGTLVHLSRPDVNCKQLCIRLHFRGNGKLRLQSLDYKNPERKDFWDALMIVAEAELKEARKQDEVDRARLRGMREPDQDAREDTAVQAAVDMDVQIFLTGEHSLPGCARGT